MKRLIGFFLLITGAWALIVPQANLGLPALRWISRYTFPGEAFVGALAITVAYLFLGSKTDNLNQHQ
jgi:hypothetical protein